MAKLQSYEELISAAKNAHLAGDTASAKRLYDRAQAVKSSVSMDQSILYDEGDIKVTKDNAGQLSLSSPSFSTSNQEDIQRFLSGDVTLPQIATGVMPKKGMNVPLSLGTGMLRGVRGILETPETLGSLGRMSYEYLSGQDVQPFPEKTVAGSLFEKGLEATTGINPQEIEYRSPTTSGKYAGTIGEFTPAAIGGATGLAKRLAMTTTAGAASEAAGQATEGTGYEPYARIGSALFTPWLGSKAFKTTNKTVNFLMNKSGTVPSVDNLKQAKNAAYKAVDDADITFSAQEIDDFIINAVEKVESSSNYVPDVDKQTLASIKILMNNAGKELSFGELDKIRQGLNKRYSQAPNEVGILSIIDDIDDLIASNTSGSDLVKAARLANSRYKKSELIERSLEKAINQASASGTGGNLINKYRQAINSIVNNPKQARFFSEEELDFMVRFVRGDVEENLLRLIGRLSPNANGLMTAVNVGAVAYNPSLLPVSVAGFAGKSAGEARSKQLVEQIQELVATGASSKDAPSIASDATRIILGSQESLNADELNPPSVSSLISGIGQ